ncbi:hypothetical protein [Candidatus Tisiphia endosymbiont of Dascillus cervinus]|uniref:hypothetical protein n=1 Tax=Candidatus Tisiphia endosymbiont of Dascillus cervinus TaxID=3066253 RepID=UPI00312CA674
MFQKDDGQQVRIDSIEVSDVHGTQLKELQDGIQKLRTEIRCNVKINQQDR